MLEVRGWNLDVGWTTPKTKKSPPDRGVRQLVYGVGSKDTSFKSLRPRIQ